MINPFDSSSAKDAVAINYSGGDHSLSSTRGPCRGLYISTAGNLAVRLANAAADVTLTGLLAGTVYPFAVAIVRQTNSTAAGLFLF